LAIWDLAERRLLHDLETTESPDFVAFGGAGSRVLSRAGDAVTVWDVAAGRSVARLEARYGFSLPPAVSVDGEFVALSIRGPGASSRHELVRVADGALVAAAAGIDGAKSWVLGPAARYAAVVESSG